MHAFITPGEKGWEITNTLLSKLNLDAGAQLLQDTLKKEGPIVSKIIAYDYMLDVTFKNMFKSPVYLDIQRSARIRIIDSKYERSILENGSSNPEDFMKAKKTYTINILIKWIREVKRTDGIWEQRDIPGEQKHENFIKLFSMPLMVGSKYCWTRNEGAKYSENLIPGYFICAGRARLLKPQEKLPLDYNIVAPHIDNKEICSQATVDVMAGTSRIRVGYNLNGNDYLCKEIGANITSNMYNHSLNVYRFYRFIMWPGGEALAKGYNLEAKERDSELQRIFEDIEKYDIKSQKPEAWIKEFDTLLEQFLTRKEATRNYTSQQRVRKTLGELTQTRSIFRSFYKVSDEKYLETILAQRNKSDFASEETKKRDNETYSKISMFQKIYDSFFGNLDIIFGGYLTYKQIRDIKVAYLLEMTGRFIEVISGARDPDDRNIWLNKRSDDPDRLILHLISTLYHKNMDQIGNFVQIKTVTDTLSSIRQHMSNVIETSFCTDTWACKYKVMNTKREVKEKKLWTKTGFMFDFLRDTPLLQFAELTQIRPPLGKGKNQVSVDVRKKKPSQNTLVSVTDTREDEMVGLVNNQALLAVATISQDEKIIAAWIRSKKGIITTLMAPGPGYTSVMENGKWIAWILDSKGLMNELLADRSKGLIGTPQVGYVTFPHFVNIIPMEDDNRLFITGNCGRLTAPFLVVDKVIVGEGKEAVKGIELLVGEEKKKEMPDMTIDVRVRLFEDAKKDPSLLQLSMAELTKRGYVEYLDSMEQHYRSYYAESSNFIENFRKVRTQAMKNYFATVTSSAIKKEDRQSVEKQYLNNWMKAHLDLVELTHVMIDPQMIIGFASAMNPLSNYASAARGVFQTKLGTHSLGCIPDAQTRYDPMTKIAFFPERPYLETQVAEILKIDRAPNGQMAIVAFMARDTNQEDAISISDVSTKNGLFRYIKYATYKIAVNKDARVTLPMKSTDKHIHLETNPQANSPGNHYGVAKIGSLVKAGDVLVNVRKILRGRGGEKTSVQDDAPLTVDAREDGYVESHQIWKQSDDSVIHLIRLASSRRYTISNKLAARYSQKGMTGEVIYIGDLPLIYINGEWVQPDIIINPHGFPGRMTIAWLYEAILSTSAMLSGKRINGSTFVDIDLDKHLDVLKENGYPEDLKFEAKNTSLGIMYEEKVLCAPIYYSALPHHEVDNTQIRGPRGRNNPITQQPLGHRQIIGASAQRFGQQEKSGTIAMGTSAVARDRLCLASDGRDIKVCATCSNIMDDRLVSEGTSYINKLVCRHCVTGSDPTLVEKMPFSMITAKQYIEGMGISIKFNVKKKTKGYLETAEKKLT